MDLDAKNREFALWLAQRLERQARLLREFVAKYEHQPQEQRRQSKGRGA